MAAGRRQHRGNFQRGISLPLASAVEPTNLSLSDRTTIESTCEHGSI
jgi:hypothetical protein